MKKAIIVVLCFCVLLMCFPVQAWNFDTEGIDYNGLVNDIQFNWANATSGTTSFNAYRYPMERNVSVFGDGGGTASDSGLFGVWLLPGFSLVEGLSTQWRATTSMIINGYSIKWQKPTTFQTGTFSIASDAKQATKTITAVNISRSLLICTIYGGDSYTSRGAVCINLTNSTTITASRYAISSGTYGVLNIKYYIIEDSRFFVQRKTISTVTSNTNVHLDTAVDTAHSLLYCYWNSSLASANCVDTMPSFNLTNSTNVNIHCRSISGTLWAVIQVLTCSNISVQHVDVAIGDVASASKTISSVNMSRSCCFVTNYLSVGYRTTVVGSTGGYQLQVAVSKITAPTTVTVYRAVGSNPRSIQVDVVTFDELYIPECPSCNSTNITVNTDLTNVTGWTNTSYNSTNGWTVNVTYTGNTSAPCDCNSTNLTIQEFLTNCIGNYTTLYDPDTGWLVNNTYAGNCTGGNASKGMAYEYYPGIGLITAFAIMFFFAGYLVREGNKKKKKEQEVENEKI